MPSHVAGLLSNTCATKTLVLGVESGYMNDMEEKAVMIMFSFLGMVSVFKLFSLVMFVNFLFLKNFLCITSLLSVLSLGSRFFSVRLGGSLSYFDSFEGKGE